MKRGKQKRHYRKNEPVVWDFNLKEFPEVDENVFYRIANVLKDYIGIKKEYIHSKFDRVRSDERGDYDDFPFGQIMIQTPSKYRSRDDYRIRIRIDWSNLVTEGKNQSDFKRMVIEEFKGI